MRQIDHYVWVLEKWPQFRWNADAIIGPLSVARRRQGELLGAMSRVGFDDRRKASAEMLTEDVIETSQIEGETLSRPAVRSSVARRLGVPVGAVQPADAKTEGTVDVMIDASSKHDEFLTSERLFGWHRSLLPIERGHRPRTDIGRFRDEANDPMQVVSSRSGRTTVHFEAPPAGSLADEMAKFLDWFNGERSVDGILRSAIAHLWFVTLHPFEDGNGRISRAIGDMALAQDENSRDRFYSMSRQIRLDKNAYYDILEKTQKGDLDITEWLVWFLESYIRAIKDSHHVLTDVLRATRFWDAFREIEFSSRQRLVLSRVLQDFEGKLTTTTWAKLGKTSTDSALRDITDLLNKGVLVKDEGVTKKSSYSLASISEGSESC